MRGRKRGGGEEGGGRKWGGGSIYHDNKFNVSCIAMHHKRIDELDGYLSNCWISWNASCVVGISANLSSNRLCTCSYGNEYYQLIQQYIYALDKQLTRIS